MSTPQPNLTHFQQRVYDATRRIPRGKVSTYKLVAEAIGCRSPRAVGQALRRNPFAPVVPCHRVIRSDLTIGGFGGKTTGRLLRRKIAMLAKEGVTFIDDRLDDPNRLYHFRKSNVIMAERHPLTDEAL